MSKSRGNDVDPVDISDRMGAEIVRLWVASVDFREDVVGSERLMKTIAEIRLQAPVNRAVITVPAYFDEPKRAATKEAGQIAGRLAGVSSQSAGIRAAAMQHQPNGLDPVQLNE